MATQSARLRASFGCSACRSGIGEADSESQPTTSVVPASLVPAAKHHFIEILRLKGFQPPVWYRLSAAAQLVLQPLFGRFGLDLGALSISRGGAFGNAGITFGNTILLSKTFGSGKTAAFDRQVALLAHEIAHSVQYRRLGWFSFLARYLREWGTSGGDPYGVPDALAATPIWQVDPVDERFYLDQICDRFAWEI